MRGIPVVTGETQAMTPQQLLRELSHACEIAGGRAAWARLHDIQPSVVTETLSGKRDPSDRVVNALGLIRVVRFVSVRKGEALHAF